MEVHLRLQQSVIVSRKSIESRSRRTPESLHELLRMIAGETNAASAEDVAREQVLGYGPQKV